MSSQKVFPDYRYALMSGICFGYIFTTTSKFFTGYGGGLGTTACLSVLITLGASTVFALLSKKLLHIRY